MFQKAQRKSVKLKLAITGPSGSGKTFSALKIAKGMGGKIALIDTENGSASLYSEYFDFDVMELTPPFTPEKYIEAINAAEKGKYDILIIDSLSHEWEGEGGLLQQKESLDQRGGNSYTNWGKMTKPHNAFNSAYLHSPLHILATIRSKQDYILETNEKGKQAPRKVGLKPIQREGTEYEFTIVFDIAMNHEASVSKDRTNLFVDKIFKINEQTGIEINRWLSSALPENKIITESKSVESLKPVDYKAQFNQMNTEILKIFNKNFFEFVGQLDVDKEFQGIFKHECLHYFQEEFLKREGKVNFDELFMKKLTRMRLNCLAVRHNAVKDIGLSDVHLKQLKSTVGTEFMKNPKSDLVEIFSREAEKFVPF